MAESDVILMKVVTQDDLFPQADPAEAVRWRRRLLLVLLVILLGALSLLVHAFTPADWNVSATRTVQSLSFPGLHEFLLFVSGFGNAPKLVSIAAIVLLACNKRSESFWLAFSGLGGWFVAMQLKTLFANPRPSADVVAVFHQWANGSFPSGHLVFYVGFFGFIFFVARDQMTRGSILRRVVMFLAVALIVLVGLSRVFLGEHWVSDLPGSYLLGALWLALSVKLYRTWKRARRRPHDWFLPYRVTER
ncbi:MAG TPA: phosphatase PAP2 family protein [Pyrinomonadaceae bacterium]|nr:phosphatase PAP2 family protein [Pyrinomonadaceae bacterium]